jgi:signal transduction histidine kinase
MNLCINAKDAMPGGGELRIEAKKEGSNALVTISDTGHGMDEETRSKCFDPFFTTKEVGKGTGLGLFTAYGIIKDHGGEIHLDSEQNKGTIFKLYFPMASAGEELKKMAWPEIV